MTRKRAPVPNEEIYDGMADEDIERNRSVDTADLHFNGKADDLPKVLMHIRLESALDSGPRDSAIRCVCLASTVWGKSLDWFTCSVLHGG